MVSVSPLEVTLDDICWCHWPVSADRLGSLVPDWVTVETAADTGWVSTVAATVDSAESFGVDVFSPAEMVTVRTYVRGPADQRGIYIVALFGDNRLGTEVISRLFRLPSRDGVPRRQAREECRVRTLDIAQHRVFECRYTTGDDRISTPPDSLASFLVDRNRYFTTGPVGSRLIGSVGHEPWQLDHVDAGVIGSPLSTLNLSATDTDPLVHHSPGIKLSVAPPVPLSFS